MRPWLPRFCTSSPARLIVEPLPWSAKCFQVFGLLIQPNWQLLGLKKYGSHWKCCVWCKVHVWFNHNIQVAAQGCFYSLNVASLGSARLSGNWPRINIFKTCLQPREAVNIVACILWRMSAPVGPCTHWAALHVFTLLSLIFPVLLCEVLFSPAAASMGKCSGLVCALSSSCSHLPASFASSLDLGTF